MLVTVLLSRTSFNATRRSASGNGRDLRSTASIAENTALFAPIATASVVTAVIVNPGERRSTRKAYRTLRSNVSIIIAPLLAHVPIRRSTNRHGAHESGSLHKLGKGDNGYKKRDSRRI